ncbi:hypothetical protein MXB02_14265 [Pseudomonas mosselii]|uniref:hypothetical protein n=1 Tax=Pseudomonas mosselii TaxID=78327 RepID=UPI001FFAF89C|nr:hypothetical protein [Pseudomonas mosselii]UPF01763.1 hypothetical protein MXB02_14265 [Pseudomonas mosselii]
MSESILNAITSAGEDRRIDPSQKRAYAVAAALEVISAKAASPEGTNLTHEFEQLSTYADQIQAALRVQ